jgi:hypothetical protein
MAFSWGGASPMAAIHCVAHSAETPLIPTWPEHQGCASSHDMTSAQRSWCPMPAAGVGLRRAEAGQVDQEHGVAAGHPVAGIGCLEGRVVRDAYGPHVEPAAMAAPDSRPRQHPVQVTAVITNDW